LWHLAVLTGLRRGELIGLRWTDVDLDNHELTVVRQRVEITGHVIESAPKTDAAYRTIALDHDTTNILIGHRLSGWTSPAADVYVFCWPDGRSLRPDWLTHRFTTLVTRLKLPPIRLHDLCHGAATLALATDADIRVIQEMLGHTNYAFTADTYISVLPQQNRDAAERASASVRACRQQMPPSYQRCFGPSPGPGKPFGLPGPGDGGYRSRDVIAGALLSRRELHLRNDPNAQPIPKLCMLAPEFKAFHTFTRSWAPTPPCAQSTIEVPNPGAPKYAPAALNRPSAVLRLAPSV
jgi:hypothetical protein